METAEHYRNGTATTGIDRIEDTLFMLGGVALMVFGAGTDSDEPHGAAAISGKSDVGEPAAGRDPRRRALYETRSM